MDLKQALKDNIHKKLRQLKGSEIPGLLVQEWGFNSIEGPIHIRDVKDLHPDPNNLGLVGSVTNFETSVVVSVAFEGFARKSARDYIEGNPEITIDNPDWGDHYKEVSSKRFGELFFDVDVSPFKVSDVDFGRFQMII
jgi:hypothetical protein